MYPSFLIAGWVYIYMQARVFQTDLELRLIVHPESISCLVNFTFAPISNGSGRYVTESTSVLSLLAHELLYAAH